MLKIKPPVYKYCPFCGRPLNTKVEDNKKRSHCSSCSWTYYPHVAASAVAVIVKNRRVLMVRRARNPYKNTWMFPAGFVDFGEHPEETLRREVNEESGLKVTEARLMEIDQSEDDPRSLGHFLFFYMVRGHGKTRNMDKKENNDIGWFDIEHPPRIGWKAQKYMMKKLKTTLSKSGKGKYN